MLIFIWKESMKDIKRYFTIDKNDNKSRRITKRNS